MQVAAAKTSAEEKLEADRQAALKLMEEKAQAQREAAAAEEQRVKKVLCSLACRSTEAARQPPRTYGDIGNMMDDAFGERQLGLGMERGLGLNAEAWFGAGPIFWFAGSRKEQGVDG